MIAEKHAVLETFTHPVFTINRMDTGIFHVQIAADTVLELKDVQDQHDFFKSRYDSVNKFIILVESGENSSLTKEAREYASLPETNSMTLGTAVVIKSLAERIITNFMINVVQQQAMKIRMFDNREKAIKWLLSLNQN